MFYEGSLQEGISTAVDQQKQVFCFVTNDNDESKTWENDFIQDSSIHGVLIKQAVCLRLEAGSEEAGYLAQIFPLPQTPTVVIMKHGELKEYIAAGTTRNEFMRRVQSSFNIPTTAEPPSPVAPAADAPPTTAAASSAAVSSEANQSDEVRRVLEERAAVMKAKEKRAEEAKKKAKANPKPKAEGQVDARKNAEAELAKQRRAQQAEDRKRILKRIEQDKEERRQLAAQKEQQRNDMRSADGVTTGPVSSIRPSKTSEMTAIQVRLFDGSTIRSRFKSNSTVKDVRKWVDETRTDGKLPYTFKQLLTPMPSKAVEETEENKQLDETGLSPSSTLILIPVRHFASAYDGASQGIVGRVFALLLSFFTWILSLVGLGGAPEQAPVRTIPVAQDKERCRNVQDAQDRRDQQLYNGNSLNFESRPDEKDE